MSNLAFGNAKTSILPEMKGDKTRNISKLASNMETPTGIAAPAMGGGTHTQMHAITHTYTHINTRKHTHTLTVAHMQQHAQACAHAHMCTNTRVRVHTHTHTAHSYFARAHSRTYTHTYCDDLCSAMEHVLCFTTKWRHTWIFFRNLFSNFFLRVCCAMERVVRLNLCCDEMFSVVECVLCSMFASRHTHVYCVVQ